MKYSHLIKKVWPYFYTYRHILVIDLIAAAFTTASEMALPLILRRMTDVALDPAQVLTYSVVIRLGLLFAGLKLIEMVASFYMASIGHIMGARIETDMRSDVYLHLQTMSDAYYNETKVGVLMSRITNDLFDITEFAHHCPEEYFIGLIKILFSFAVLIRVNVPLTLIIFVMIPFMIVAASKYRGGMKRAQKEQKVQVGDLNSSIEESLLGVKVVKSFANEEVESAKFNRENYKLLGVKRKYYRFMAGFNVINRGFDGLMFIVVIFLGGHFLVTDQISTGDMMAYTLYVSSLLATVRRIVEFTEQFQRGMTGIERFSEIMATESDIVDAEDAVSLSDVLGRIVFDHVDFKYERDTDYVLKDFNLTVEPGANLAIVGPSGSGKTTICNLIPRFYDVNGGTVSVDGVDVRQVQLKSLRENIGIMQQDVYLFSGSVLENIRYGRPEAPDEDVYAAARMAGAFDFIMDLPNGFDTYVGERGVKLSGGQKQRISIARVFLKNPPILILDEATSALDNKSEAIVQASLEELTKGRTTITIAHRLSTVQHADEILVMKDRAIIERGTHRDLMARRGYYFDLYTKGGSLLE
ncbi:ABC transporter ATP-binding protein [Peptoniphilus equinus]|uniref:ABC transporter ATP-binding protein n=1 Tax=Peptoniphilus equinus TaxID=3016343 RepID=A0ABY7QSI0_9FIRM|nr:ABC transporter ATP-binding protein [Peptoniphilus equinus]WBW49745.1 ABC transporter ATP-binding protein [Peptoniphilus equinus]